MAYQENKPAAIDQLNQSQGDIQGNFAAIKTLVDINHETFGTADQGKHKYVTLPEQVAGPATAANEMALYTKEVGGASALFLRKEGSGSEINFTTATLTSGASGYCVLPCGLKMNWGKGTASTGVANRVVFSSAFTDSGPGAGVSEPNILSVQLTLYTDANENNFISVVNGTTRYDGFYARSWSRSGGVSTSHFYYLAIGI